MFHFIFNNNYDVKIINCLKVIFMFKILKWYYWFKGQHIKFQVKIENKINLRHERKLS